MADEEKTEPATSRRRQEARKKGQVAKSMELSSALILLAGFSMLAVYGPVMFLNLQRYLRWTLSPAVLVHMSRLNEYNVTFLNRDMFFFSAKIMFPFVAVILAVSLAINYMQVGFKVAPEAIKPKFSKLNPLSGFKRIFSLRSVTELLKSILKVTIVAWVCYSTIRNSLPQFVNMTIMETREATALFAMTTITLALKIALLLVLLAILDWMYQKYDFDKSIKMSKQEVKDEYKQREGDPLVRRRIREKQRELAVRRMMAAVPHADVVITNPVELAIALQYVADDMHAPKVVAKGGGVVAERIKEVAKENKVPIVENKPLAQALFKLTDVGDFVPPQLFKAVAEILAYVYRLGKKEHSFGI